jgi:flagellar hook-basal body complex protein FliE
MKIGEISNVTNSGKSVSLLNSLDTTATKSVNNNEVSFTSLLKQSLDEVNNSQVQAYNAMEDIATGKVENLQEAVQTIEEAELSLKLGLEVKNKAIGAYKQIMSMQI